uniref:Odorant receptor n=2 Tax=Rhodnius prolixus TaxID=13249 RepID=T1HDM1_RHOPR
MKKGFLDNNGYFMALGGQYLCFPGNWILPFLHITTGSIHIVLLACTAYIVNIQDLAIMCESLHFVVVLATTCTMEISSLMLRSKIEYVMRTLGEGVYSYEDSLDEASLKEMRQLSSKAKYGKKLGTRIFVILVMLTSVVISFVRPIIMHLIQKLDYSDDFKGLNRYLPVHTWFPFDTHDIWVRILCGVNQFITIYTVPCTVFGFDLTFLCISEEIIYQLKTVGLTMRNVKVRAKTLMKSRADMDFGSALTKCLNHSVEHHNVVARLFKVFNDVYYYSLLMMMTGATFMLCLSCILFTAPDVGFSSKGTFLCFLLAELFHTFLFCWYGDQMKEASSNILNEIYGSDWIEYSVEMKLYIIMVMHRSLKPLTVDAGGFMDASMHTFANVLSSAYSYFNLLNAAR